MNDSARLSSTHSSILERLRHETRAEHEAVERDLPLLEPSFDREGFRIYLARAFGFHDAIERALLPSSDSLPELALSTRAKAPLLAADLRQLGYDAPALSRLPRCQALPSLGTEPQRLGCLYVTEGSTLGAQLLRRSLSARWPDLEPAMSFFRGYGPDTARQWQALGACLTRRCREVEHANAAVASARETFRAFRAWLAPLNGALRAVG